MIHIGSDNEVARTMPARATYLEAIAKVAFVVDRAAAYEDAETALRGLGEGCDGREQEPKREQKHPFIIHVWVCVYTNIRNRGNVYRVMLLIFTGFRTPG